MKKIAFIIFILTIFMFITMMITSCDKIKTPNEPIQTEHEHQYTCKVTTVATCVKTGVVTFTCSVCNDVYTEEIAARGQHSYISQLTTAATCGKDGVKTITCSECNNSYTEKIAATGKHNYTSRVTTAATCTKDGVKTFACSVCNNSYTEKIAAIGQHSYTSKVTTEATCTKDGVKTFTCSACGYSYTESVTKLGHTWSVATCTTPQTCTVCKITQGDALGHTTDDGTCSRCNAVIDSQKWSYSETLDLNNYAVAATKNAQKAFQYAIDAMKASSTLKELYNQYAVYYASIAKGYLKDMKAIADSNAKLDLTSENENYATLQEKINYAYSLCDELANLQITSSNELEVCRITSTLSTQCLGIQKIALELLSLFSS